MTAIEGLQLPEDAIALGWDTYYVKTYYGDVWVGINEYHREGDKWSVGSIPFANRAALTNNKLPDATISWDVGSYDPLTLSPSLACRSCGHHGFIHGGQWWPV